MGAYLAGNGALLPKQSYCDPRSLGIRDIAAPEVVSVLAKWVGNMPGDFSTMFTAHEMRAASPSATATYSSSSTSSVLTSREPHWVLEILAGMISGDDPAATKESFDWALGFRDALIKEAPGQVLPARWVAINPDQDVDVKVLFGEHYEKVVALKKKLDPRGVFKHAAPRIPV